MDLPPDTLPTASGLAALAVLGKELAGLWWKSRQKKDDDDETRLRALEVAVARLDERGDNGEAEVKDLRRIKDEILQHITALRGHLEHLREHGAHVEKRVEEQFSRLFEMVRELRGDTNPKGRPPA